MKRLFVLSLSIAIGGLFATSDLHACGDKVMLLGRGARYSQYSKTKQPLSILLYKHPNLGKGSGLKDFEAAVKRIGHKLFVAQSLKELNETLQLKKVNYVVVDPSDASALRQTVESAPSKPMLVSMNVPAKVKEAVYLSLMDEAAKAQN